MNQTAPTVLVLLVILAYIVMTRIIYRQGEPVRSKLVLLQLQRKLRMFNLLVLFCSGSSVLPCSVREWRTFGKIGQLEAVIIWKRYNKLRTIRNRLIKISYNKCWTRLTDRPSLCACACMACALRVLCACCALMRALVRVCPRLRPRVCLPAPALRACMRNSEPRVAEKWRRLRITYIYIFATC